MLYSKVPPSFLAILHLQHRPAATTGVPSFHDCHSSLIPASQQTPSFPPCSQLDRRFARLELSAVANGSRGRRVVTGASPASPNSLLLPEARLDGHPWGSEVSAVAKCQRWKGRQASTCYMEGMFAVILLMHLTLRFKTCKSKQIQNAPALLCVNCQVVNISTQHQRMQ